MHATKSHIVLNDSNGTARTISFLDADGSGSGPFVPIHALVDKNGECICEDNPMSMSGTVSVSNYPAIQAVSGSVDVRNFPLNQTISGIVSIGNFPAIQTISGQIEINNFPLVQAVSGSVAVSNLPTQWPISGSVTVSNLPSTQAVSGTVSISNLPTTQAIAGQVAVSNFPATQAVTITSVPLAADAATASQQIAANDLLAAIAGKFTDMATAARQDSILAILGGVLATGGSSTHINVVPTLTVQSYGGGKCLGGIMTFPGVVRAAGKSATLQSATLRSKSANTVQIDLVIFRDLPTVMTGIANGVTFAVDNNDLDKVMKVISFSTWNNVGGATVSTIDGIGKLLAPTSGIDLKGILIARGLAVSSWPTDFSLSLAFSQD